MMILAFPVSAAPAEEPYPFAGQGCAGYFVFEARGSEISAAAAAQMLQTWAAAAWGGETAADLVSGSDTLATGNMVEVSSGGAQPVKYGIIIRGDVTKTGKPGLAQLVATARGLTGAYAADPVLQIAADLDGSGKIDITDVVRASQYLLGADPDGPLYPSAPVNLPRETRSSSNINRQNYSVWARPVCSYLYENPAGNLVRVEYVGNEVVVEEYDAAFLPVSSLTLEAELPLWGGFFAGEKFNFLIWGQNNKEEDNGKEVIRIVKYDKDWNRLGAAGLYGANTTEPFDAGSLRCDEYGGWLYIRTCHEMYTTDDGLNHQANVMIALNQEEMRITDSFTDIMNISTGYISHSFNQFVMVDSAGRIVTLDHGDAHPRGIVLLRYYAAAGQEKFTNLYPMVQTALIENFPEAPGGNYNVTGASVGGICETSVGYLTAYNFDGAATTTQPRDIYLTCIGKNVNGGCVQVTHGANTLTPQLIPTSMEGGYLTWMSVDADRNTHFNYTEYRADGSVGSIRTADAAVSDCQPICWNGKVVWYVTDQSAPVFYTLDADGVQSW